MASLRPLRFGSGLQRYVQVTMRVMADGI